MSALYDRIGDGYAGLRRADPRIAAHLDAALGPPAPLLNLGAGTGNYEPEDRWVVAVEPSVEMIRQRPAKSASALVTGVSAQVDLRSSRINDFSDAAWINEPPALDTAMLDQIKSAIREGRFVINEQAIAQALSEDASR